MGIKERRAYERQLRLDQILDAARSLLHSKGIENISISRIAKHAELGVGTIYFYFKNKEEIFIALQEEGLSILNDIITRISARNIKNDEKLMQVADAFYTFKQDYKDYYDLLNYFLSSPKEFFNPRLKNQVDMSGYKIFSQIETIVRKGVLDRTFRPVDTGKFSILFFGSLLGLMQLKKLEQTALASENHRDIYQFSVKQLISGLKQH